MVFEKGYIELIEYLISLDKMDINIKYILIFMILMKNFNKIIIHETVFYRACKSGNLEIVRYLISSNKVYVNEKNVFIL